MRFNKTGMVNMHDKKEIFGFISDLSEIVRKIVYIAIFFYLSEIIWPYIQIPFVPPEGVLGFSFIKLGFNPLNNSLRFAVTLLVTLGSFGVISLLNKRKQKWAMRLIFITILAVSFFLTAFIYPKSEYYIDLFHDGQQIGSAALHLQGRPLYLGNILVHGPIDDALRVVSSFQLFGKSIGSFLMLTAFLHLTAFILFFILLLIYIKSDLIFYLASVWFYNLVTVSIDFQRVNFVVATIRDIFVYLTVLLLWFLVKKNWNSKFLLFAIGLLAGFQYFVSLDRAYLLSIMIFFLFLYRLMPIFSKPNFRISVFVQNFKYNLFLAGGFLTGFLIQIPLFGGVRPFLGSLQFIFNEYPKMAMLFAGTIFPSYAESPVVWFPIFVIIFNGVFVFQRIRDRNFKLNSNELYLFFLFIFSIVLFINGLNGHTDLFHLLYGATIVFLLCFLILDEMFQMASSGLSYLLLSPFKYFSGILIILYILFNYNVPDKDFHASKRYQKTYYFRREDCYIEKEDNREARFQGFADYYLLNHLRCPPGRSFGDVKNFFTINKKADEEWLTEYSRKIIRYINDNTTEKDFVFVFTNEQGYYYFLKAKSPTRFSMVVLAGTSKNYQEELINDLKINSPKLILYSTGSWAESAGGVTSINRFSELNSWMLKNYPQKTIIDQATILEKEIRTDKVPTSTPAAIPPVTPILKKISPTVTPT